MSRRGYSKQYLRQLRKTEREKYLKRLNCNQSENVSPENNINPVEIEMEYDINPKEIEDTEESFIYKEVEVKSLEDKLKEWYITYNPPRGSFEALLKILKEENLNVPTSFKSVLKNNEKIITTNVAPGAYYHFGIESELKKIEENLSI